ncbi:MAG: cysteine desulfuration protein SufE [Alphaproteobacteria bacterium HGW-Alphaproteobacteria-2]|nr:MAG: cysteine desulfuration protein SufE [Alphaproteobacteria bacterium HGW-Alphaproteobacteria-2]
MAEAEFEDIAETFDLLEDWEERYRYVIELGRTMPSLEEALRGPETKVEGCASQVWIVPEIEGQGAGARFSFRGDSDAMIVRGLIAVLRAPAIERAARHGRTHPRAGRGRRGRLNFLSAAHHHHADFAFERGAAPWQERRNLRRDGWPIC